MSTERKLVETTDKSVLLKNRRFVGIKETVAYVLEDTAASLNINDFKERYIYDVVKIDFSYLAIQNIVATIWDTFNDTFIGVIVEKTRTRWGKFKPYLLLGQFPLTILGLWYWLIPFIFPDTPGDYLPKWIFFLLSQKGGHFLLSESFLKSNLMLKSYSNYLLIKRIIKYIIIIIYCQRKCIMANKNRPLYILKYLWDNTDEEHPAIITDILAHLEKKGIHTNRKTVASDLADLQDSGFDIVFTKSRQNKYFIGNRTLELAELKMIVDAIQAAKFISENKSMALIEKVSALGSPHQSEQLKRRLYVEGKAKTTNETVNYTVDFLQAAINSKSAVEFQYIEYTAEKEKELKHNGYWYRFSPYDLVWNNDCYYILGWSEKHGKIVKFRVDRICHVKESVIAFNPPPESYDITEYFEQVFMMFEGKECTVHLLCDNGLMKTIIDRFGEDVETRPFDDTSFIAVVEVSVSPTFYSWIFTFGGKIQIAEPTEIKEEYKNMLEEALN